MASRSHSSLSAGLGAFVYRLFVIIVELMIVRGKPRRGLEAEVIALRHQVTVLHRTATRPEFTDFDRGAIAGVARVLPRRVRHRFMVTPDTFLAWHRRLAAARRVRPPRRPGRPRVVRDREQLVIRLAAENPTRATGASTANSPSSATTSPPPPSGHPEMPRLDPAPRRTGPTWTQFLTAQARGIIACDTFVVADVELGLRQLHVQFFIEHTTRRVHLARITSQLTGGWCTQAARNLAMTLHIDRFRFLIRDNATVFDTAFDQVFTTNQLDVTHTPPGALRANATTERFVRTARTELHDHILIWNERQPHKLLGEYLEHDNGHRPHRGINQCSPDSIDQEPAEPVPLDRIRQRRILGGLINEYHHAA